MKKTHFISSIFSLVLLLAVTPVYNVEAADKNGKLNEHLKALEPFIGKTWKGTAPNPDPDKPFVDVSRWERALNGQAVRVLHSINGGEYGGETIIMWDRDKESIVFYYFTTAGFFTNGTMETEENKIVSHEVVTGEKNGITEVKAVGRILPDGRMHSEARYLKNGEWVDGHEFYYEEAPGAKVILR